MKNAFAIFLIVAAGCVSRTQPMQSDVPKPGPAPLFVFVGGEVRQPGRFPWTNGITATGALKLAGGFTDFVSSRWLLIKHWDGSREKHRLTSDYRLMSNIALKPGDVIHSPRWKRLLTRSLERMRADDVCCRFARAGPPASFSFFVRRRDAAASQTRCNTDFR